MFKRAIKSTLRNLGYEVYKIEAPKRAEAPIGQPPPVSPVWPLPRRAGGPTNEEIAEEFSKYGLWHYAYQFEGGLSFSVRHNNATLLADEPDRPLKRFKHFMPYLLQSQGGSLRDKRILDIACNSGFWSMQCALLGADVIGFDARQDLIAQANLIKSIVGLNNVDFRMLDFWEMNPKTLGGKFDIVLNLGILYHLPKPLEALELTKSMAEHSILLDTEVFPMNLPVIGVHWEDPVDIRSANTSGIVARPSKCTVDLMLRHIGVAEWFEIPIRASDMPRDYLEHRRISWLISV